MLDFPARQTIFLAAEQHGHLVLARLPRGPLQYLRVIGGDLPEASLAM